MTLVNDRKIVTNKVCKFERTVYELANLFVVSFVLAYLFCVFPFVTVICLCEYDRLN